MDRIYDDELPESERQPACVMTCPTHARFFGDLDDPQSEAATLVRERGGEQLMPELGYNPTNIYLRPRETAKAPAHDAPPKPELADDGQSLAARVKNWVNRAVTR